MRYSYLLVSLVLLLVGCTDQKHELAVKKFTAARAVTEGEDGTEGERHQKALVLVREALALDPAYQDARICYARLLTLTGKFSQALKEAAKVTAPTEKNSITVALASAALFQVKGDPFLVDDALSGLSEAGDGITVAQRFQIAFWLIDSPSKLSGYNKALNAGINILKGMHKDGELNPDQLAYLGLAYYKAHRDEAAATCLEEALKSPELEKSAGVRAVLERIRKK